MGIQGGGNRRRIEIDTRPKVIQGRNSSRIDSGRGLYGRTKKRGGGDQDWWHTKMGTISEWRQTGRGLVKKSAQLSSDLTYGIVNSRRETRSRIQLNRWSMDFDFLGMTVWVERPIAHSLSQNMGVGGWG